MDPITGEEDRYSEGCEIVRILKGVINQIERGEVGKKIMDINGNCVGSWKR